MKRITYLLLFLSSLHCQAQEPWSVDQCIQYAVTHNRDVRMQRITVDDYKNEQTRAVGAFLPRIEGSVSGQYNFGRAIDPETNTYTNVSTFYNGYSLSANIPLFDGLQQYNNLRAAKASLLMGKSQLAARQDQTARNVMESYLQVLYYAGCIEIAAEKRAESELLLKQTRRMVEVGQKGEADLAQMQATYATDDYEVTHQQSLYDKALLALKQQMNFPPEALLQVAPQETLLAPEEGYTGQPAGEIFEQARQYNPEIKQAEYNLLSAKYAYRSSKGALFPSLSMGVGVSTTYYKQLHVPNTTSFNQQFRNNVGEYVYFTLSIPLFNRMNTLSNIRRQRNNLRKAEEELEYRHHELNRLVMEACTDQENSRKEMEKLRAKVESDRIATRLTTRKYEEGLASSIDVQTSAVTLLQSKVQLLQSQLTYIYKTRILNYYKGAPLWTE